MSAEGEASCRDAQQTKEASKFDEIPTVPIPEQTIYSDSDAAEEFHCAVCFRLAVEPTTLSCGHTSCRLCLARWFLTSKKKECPLCREVFQGHPKVNTQLRNLLMRVAPNEMQTREKEVSEDTKGKQIVERFNKELSKEATGASTTKSDFLSSFCSGIIVTLCSLVVIYLAWYWQYSDHDLLIRKPVQTWKPKDVEKWLMEMPWAQCYAPLAVEHGIDGRFLLSLDAGSMTRLMNVTHEDQLRALIFSINILKEQGVKMPVTLWDYKAIYPGRSIFLLFSLRNFPRTSVLYMWAYFYDEMFLPLVRATTHSDNDLVVSFNPYDVSLSEPSLTTNTMLSEFVFYTIFIPQYPIILFAWQMFQHHTFTPVFVLATAVLCLLHDIHMFKILLLARQWREYFTAVKRYMQDLASAVAFMVMWPLIPHLFVDVIFYGALYITPVQLSIELYHKVRHL